MNKENMMKETKQITLKYTAQVHQLLLTIYRLPDSGLLLEDIFQAPEWIPFWLIIGL